MDGGCEKLRARGTLLAVCDNIQTMQNLSTAGGELLYFYGDFFGPRAPNLVTRVQALNGQGAVISSAACTVLDSDVLVACAAPSGVGTNFLWQVRNKDCE